MNGTSAPRSNEASSTDAEKSRMERMNKLLRNINIPICESRGNLMSPAAQREAITARPNAVEEQRGLENRVMVRASEGLLEWRRGGETKILWNGTWSRNMIPAEVCAMVTNGGRGIKYLPGNYFEVWMMKNVFSSFEVLDACTWRRRLVVLQGTGFKFRHSDLHFEKHHRS